MRSIIRDGEGHSTPNEGSTCTGNLQFVELWSVDERLPLAVTAFSFLQFLMQRCNL